MSWMFCGCSSLNFLPDISKWNITNVNNINRIFFDCNSLSLLPDLSKWKNVNNIDIYHIIGECINIMNLSVIQNLQ